MNPIFLMALILMFAGPLLQGLAGFSDPNAYVFAPLIAVAVLPLQGARDMAASLRLAGMFLAIGAAALALWWLGSRVTPPSLSLPALAPVGVSVAGALLALVARRGRRA